MTQYYQSRPYLPPPRGPEEYDDYEYYEEDNYNDDEEELEGNPLLRWGLILLSGGCLLFACLGCCFLVGAGLWIWDPGAGLVATPLPGSDLGLTFDEPAFSDESVVNENNTQLTILEVNRNVALPDFAPTEGRELIVVTIELINLGSEEISYNESDFVLINPAQEAYQVSPATATVDGALGRGQLGPNEGLEARLVFDILAGESNLVLEWKAGREVQPRYIFIE